MRTLADVIQALAIHPDVGLTDAAIARSRQQFGKNELTPLPRAPLWRKFIEKFNEPIIKILLAAALLSMGFDLFKHFSGDTEGPILIEGLAVMIAVILATGVAFASEYKSDREFEVLNSRKESIRVKSLRAGQIRGIAVEEVVVGDVVLLEAGDEIPADGRLLKASELMIDQSLMTGESEPIPKTAQPQSGAADGLDQPGCVYRGTQVVDGAAHMMVTEVGDQTCLGVIARRLADDAGDECESEETRVKRKLTISKDLTPLQQKLAHLADLISKVGYAAAGLIFVAQLMRGWWLQEIFWPASADELIQVLRQLLGYFVTMVIVIVVAVPEGLPMSVTISLALAMRKMTRTNSLVRQLVACETIGSATVICTDKTGTLTQNKMRVERVSWADQVIERGSPAWNPPEIGGRKFVILPMPESAKREPCRRDTPLAWLTLISALNSTASLEEKQGKIVTIGNSTEGALLHWLRDAGTPYGEVRLCYPSVYQIHFSSERKRMTTVIDFGGRLVALVKGSPEGVLERCAQYLDAGGELRILSEEMRGAIRRNLRDAAGLSMRTLAFAYAPLPESTPSDVDGLHALRHTLDTELVYVGFVAIRDPLREDVKDAIAECRKAGIEVKMITGDNVETARAIAFEVGLVDRADAPIDSPCAAVLTSQRLGELNDTELKQQLPGLRVVARAKPLDKFRLVRLLQELGEVVAVTGDGTNDAPALKKADVGLAMGIAGTEVSKEASKIVLLDDAFSTIVKAVHWGRSLYENIQKFIQFQLTINVSALVITLLGILIGVKAPFTVLQLLWINVIMDTFASIALCSEPPRPGVMKMRPKKRDENIVTPTMVKTIALTAGFFIVVMLGLLLAMQSGWLAGGPMPAVGYTLRQMSLFFSIYVFFQVWNQINCRSLTPEVSGLHRLGSNPIFLAIAGLVALGQIVIVTFGGTVFHVESLGVLEWLGVIGLTSSVLVFAEVVRFMRKMLPPLLTGASR